MGHGVSADRGMCHCVAYMKAGPNPCCCCLMSDWIYRERCALATGTFLLPNAAINHRTSQLISQQRHLVVDMELIYYSGFLISAVLAILLISVYLILAKVHRWITRCVISWKHDAKEPPYPNINLDRINRESAQNHSLLETATNLFWEHGKTYKTKRNGRVMIRT